MRVNTTPKPNDLGLCFCGCGQRTNLYRGKPNHYVRYHHLQLPRPDRIEALLWSRVDKSGGEDACWPWLGKTSGGYAVMPSKGLGSWMAHRVVYELEIGPIPTCHQIDHLCRNRACCNPAHLEAVTARENTLRSDSVAARNARKTHCPQGHPYSGDNLAHKPDGSRRCRQCGRDYARRNRNRPSVDAA